MLTHSDASVAVEWLNMARGTGAHRRVLAIRQELDNLGTMFDNIRAQKQAAKSRRPQTQKEILDDLAVMGEWAGVQEQFRQRHNAFNQLLSRYTFVPVLAYNLDVGRWNFNTVPKRVRGPEVKLDDQTIIVRANEATVVAALARLAAKRELSKVRLCEGCRERWRVSLRQMDKFCSDECRISFHVHSEVGKQRHREAQQRYRNSDGYRNAAK